MKKDTIITLDDNTEYALLDETTIDNQKYFFAIKLENKTNNPTNEYEIFELIEEENEVYMDTVEDENFKQSIMVTFTNNYMKMIEKITESK